MFPNLIMYVESGDKYGLSRGLSACMIWASGENLPSSGITIMGLFSKLELGAAALGITARVHGPACRGLPALSLVEHQSEEYAAVNPMKKIPAMQDGDFKLTESIAIVKYLQSKYACPDHWYPADLKARARVDEYLAWQHMNTRLNVAKVFLKQVIFPRMTGTPPDPAALAPDIQRMEETLDNIETYFLRDKPFLCGDDISIADLFGVNEVIQIEPCGYGTIDRRPKLKAWIGRVRERVQPEIFDDVCQLIYKLAKTKPKL